MDVETLTSAAPREIGLTAGCAVAVLAALSMLLFANSKPPSTPAIDQPSSRAYGDLPISFQPNRGQSDGAVRFLSTGAGYGLFLTNRRAVLDLGGSAISMSLVGATPSPQVTGLDRLPGRVNYLGGRRSRSVTSVPTYSAVHYAAVWPGIGIRFYGNQRRLEYDFELAPGADPAAIGLRFAGQQALRIDRSGGLTLGVDGHTIRQLRPAAYQVIDGARHPVASRYMLRGGRVEIALGAYDRQRPLTIDPKLVYSTYLGRGIDGRGYAIDVDRHGNAYITGDTTSPRFPITRGALQPKPRGNRVAFVTKLNRSGSRVLYSTYLSGRSGSSGSAIAVDPAGDAYVTGLAYSPGFPTTEGAFQEKPPSSENAFATKLSPSGSRLLYSTYLGGGGEGGGVGGGIAIDRAGDAFVAGYTFSREFPTTPGAAQSTKGKLGETNGFAAELNPTGRSLVYSTYLGGNGDDSAEGIAVDGAGNAYVTGSAQSKDFPTTPGAFQTVNHAGNEFTNAFVTKLDPTGTRFLYSTYLGGNGLDRGIAVAVDDRGAAYVTGNAGSPDFPTTRGVYQTHLHGFDDAFATVLSPDGHSLLSSTLLGSEATGRGIALDRAGDVLLTGLTNSKRFPTTPGAFQRKIGARHIPKHVDLDYNGFFSKLNQAGTKLLYSTFLGGRQARAASIAVDQRGAAYITGGAGQDFPTRGGVPQPPQPSQPEYPNAFVVKLNP